MSFGVSVGLGRRCVTRWREVSAIIDVQRHGIARGQALAHLHGETDDLRIRFDFVAVYCFRSHALRAIEAVVGYPNLPYARPSFPFAAEL